jgi:hypothetical protein
MNNRRNECVVDSHLSDKKGAAVESNRERIPNSHRPCIELINSCGDPFPERARLRAAVNVYQSET